MSSPVYTVDMAGLLLHRNVWGPKAATGLGQDGACDGEIKQLYVRRVNPQRWLTVGHYCTQCLAVAWKQPST
jgi:hypothetical protein